MADEAIATYEEQELQGVQTAELYSALFAAYLLKGDLPNARFLWKRIPTATKNSTPELDALWQVCLTLWNRIPVFTALGAFGWSAGVANMIAALKDKETAAALDLLAQSYSAVKVAHAATSLGVAPDQAVAMATAQGWVHDASSAALAPPPKGSAAPESGEGVTLQQLADITLHLEK
eukprot:gene6647-26073_t